MKNQSFKKLVVMVPVLMSVISGAPTSSQKSDTIARPDNVSPALVVRDSASATPIDSLLKVAHEKVDKAAEVMDKVGKRGDRIISKIESIKNRQANIRMLLTPVQVEWNPRPLPPKELEASPPVPEIKPVDIEKPSWWQRKFGRDKK